MDGHLNIRLKISKGAADTVSIKSSRPVYASRVFHGKSVAESQQMIPLLFSICANAQACAGVRACEQALGLQVAAQTEQMRDATVNMETLREHLWRILLDWPAFIGAEADKQGMAEMAAIQRDYRQAICPSDNVFQIGGTDCRTDIAALKGVFERFVALIQQKVFTLSPGAWLALVGQEAFVNWVAAGETLTAQLIDQVMRAGWSSAGNCESEALPRLTEEQLHQAMQDVNYIKQPEWSGLCCETSSLTRATSPLLNALKQAYGNGLLVRLVARLVEIALLTERLLPNTAEVAGDDQKSVFRPANPGIGQAEAARGLLVHRVELNGDVFCNYQILAPTEWNFHPKGVVVEALSTLLGDPESVEKQARLLINTIDPCVDYDLSITGR